MDKQMKAFNTRLKQIDKAENGGFFTRRNRERRALRLPLFRLLIFFALTYCALTAAKITMERDLGAQGYTARLAELSEGDESARIAAKLMQRDRFMGFLDDYI